LVLEEKGRVKSAVDFLVEEGDELAVIAVDEPRI